MAALLRRCVVVGAGRCVVVGAGRGAAAAISTTAPRLAPLHLQSYSAIGDVDPAEAEAVLERNAGLLSCISKMDWEASFARLHDSFASRPKP